MASGIIMLAGSAVEHDLFACGGLFHPDVLRLDSQDQGHLNSFAEARQLLERGAALEHAIDRLTPLATLRVSPVGWSEPLPQDQNRGTGSPLRPKAQV